MAQSRSKDKNELDSVRDCAGDENLKLFLLHSEFQFNLMYKIIHLVLIIQEQTVWNIYIQYISIYSLYADVKGRLESRFQSRQSFILHLYYINTTV